MGKQVKTFEDVDVELRRINGFIDSFKGASLLDFKGRPIKNVGAGKDPNDVVIVSQLPVIKNQTFTYNDYRAIIWSNPGVLYTQEDEGSDKVISKLEWYGFGRFLASKPIQLWIKFETAPSDGSCTIQLEHRLSDTSDPADILINPLEVQEAATEGSDTAAFTTPMKVFGEGSSIRPRVITHGEIAVVSIGLVVERII